MSPPRISMLLLFVVVVVAGNRTTSGHHPPLLDCGPAPVLSKNDDATFRANLASTLAILPAAVAADREAFATVHVGMAFESGTCFGANVSSSPSETRACEACLSAAARYVNSVCGASSGRAGVWSARCFLSFGDQNASTAREEAFWGWFYAGAGTEQDMLEKGECLRDRAANCGRCLNDSARAAAALRWWHRIHGEEVIVVGYSCFARIRMSSLPQGPDDVSIGSDVRDIALFTFLDSLFGAAATALGLAFIRIIKIVRALPQANNG